MAADATEVLAEQRPPKKEEIAARRGLTSREYRQLWAHVRNVSRGRLLSLIRWTHLAETRYLRVQQQEE